MKKYLNYNIGHYQGRIKSKNREITHHTDTTTTYYNDPTRLSETSTHKYSVTEDEIEIYDRVGQYHSFDFTGFRLQTEVGHRVHIFTAHDGKKSTKIAFVDDDEKIIYIRMGELKDKFMAESKWMYIPVFMFAAMLIFSDQKAYGILALALGLLTINLVRKYNAKSHIKNIKKMITEDFEGYAFH